MRKRVSTDVAKDIGILYVLEIELEGKKLIKVGITHRKIQDRVVEILASIWRRYRIFPFCYPKRFREVVNVAVKEAKMHELLEEFRYTTLHRFTGHTEMFDVDMETVLRVYEEVVNESGNSCRDGSDGSGDGTGEVGG